MANINELRIPIVADIDGFIRVQNTRLSARDKTLVVLHYKQPNKVRDSDIANWILYKNITQYRKDVLGPLHSEAFVHYVSGSAILLPKGERYIEQNIGLDLLI